MLMSLSKDEILENHLLKRVQLRPFMYRIFEGFAEDCDGD